MKIIEMPPYYLPEQISSTHLTTDLTEAFIEQGFTIENYAPSPCRGLTDDEIKKFSKIKYEELYGGKVKIFRFPMCREGRNPFFRAIRYFVSNLIQGKMGSQAENVDLVIGGSTPPIQGLMCGRVARKLSKKNGKKVPFLYLLQDIFPDSLVNAKMTKKGSLIWKIGRKIEDVTYHNADKIIVISESMKRNIIDKGVPEEKIAVISNWVDTEATTPVAKENNCLFEEFSIPKDRFIVLYAGNFGKAQGADVILETAEKLKDDKNIRFVIFGGGEGFEEATKRVENLENVIINPLLPQNRVSEVYSLGDVALITCKAGVGNSGMPSKTWSIMACNTPIIAAFDTGSELAEIIEKANAGITVDPEDPDKLASAILEMADGKASSFAGGREYTLENASKEKCVAKYVETINSLLGREEEHVTA